MRTFEKLRNGYSGKLKMLASDFIDNYYSNPYDCALSRTFKRNFKVLTEGASFSVGGMLGNNVDVTLEVNDDNIRSTHIRTILIDLTPDSDGKHFDSDMFRNLSNHISEMRIQPNEVVYEFEYKIVEIKY